MINSIVKEGYILATNDNRLTNKKPKIKASTGINIVGFILVVMAGWVDTIGVSLFLNQRSSSMSGRGHILGYWIFKLDFKMAMSIALIMISFIIGACISTLITRKTGLVGGLLFTGLLIIIGSFTFSLYHTVLSKIFVPMAMGCQNAATSLTEIRRTTHLTGASTDLGINIAKGNWQVVRFWMLRLIGFPLGSVIGFNLVNLVNNNVISISIALIIPAIIIILTAIGQNKFLDIPLID